MRNANAAVKIEGLGQEFGSVQVLREIDLDVAPGELVCLLGPSGCGKTTLLRSIAGLDVPQQGRISINGRVMVDRDSGEFVRPEARGLGMVFQHYALWPQMTVLQNVSYPLKRRGIPRRERLSRAAAATETVGLGTMLDRYPHQLSGGQQQRVALARAVVHEPRVLLLDEPLSNLDATLRQQLRRELRRLHERLGSTMVHVTHDQHEAAAIADTVVVMDAGRVVQRGAPNEILNTPNSRFVAEFVGFDVFVPGELVTRDTVTAVIQVGAAGQIRTAIPTAIPSGTAVDVALRSADLVLRDEGVEEASQTSMTGRVERVSPIGPSADVEICCGGSRLEVRTHSSPENRPTVGQTVRVGFDPARVLAIRAGDERPSPGAA